MTIIGGTRLEDVLDGMLSEYGSPSPEAIAGASALHPEHRAALLEFAAGWAEEEHLPPLGATPRAHALERAIEQRARGRFSEALATRTRVAGLADLARGVGSSLQELAQRCRIDLSVMRKLDAGRISPGSVGEVLPSRIGEILGVAKEAVVAALGVAPPSLAAAGFLAPVRLPPSEDLRDALLAAGAGEDVLTDLGLVA